MESVKFINNESQKRYELHVEGAIAVAEYIIENEVVQLTGTQVPKELQGRGLASILMEKVLEDIEQQKKYVVPVCSFVKNYIEKNPKWQSLLEND